MILILSLEIEFGFNLFLDLCGLRVLYIDQPSYVNNVNINVWLDNKMLLVQIYFSTNEIGGIWLSNQMLHSVHTK